MVDAISGIIGMALMIAFLSAIALKLAELPLWVVSLFAIALMAVAFWQDSFAPLFRRSRESRD